MAKPSNKTDEDQIVKGAPRQSVESRAVTGGPKAASDVRAAAGIEITRIDPLPPLNAAAVKTAYLSNADTNNFTDAADLKLRNIEANAKDDLTAAEIVALLTALIGNARLDASAIKNLPTGGSTEPGSGAPYNVATLSAGGATVDVHYIGATAPGFSGSASAGFDLSVQAGTHITAVDFIGQSSTSNGSGELVLRTNNSANGYDRRFTMDIYDGGNKQPLDKYSVGIIEAEQIAANVTTTTVPNIAGSFGASGFIAKFR